MVSHEFCGSSQQQAPSKNLIHWVLPTRGAFSSSYGTKLLVLPPSFSTGKIQLGQGWSKNGV